MSPMPSQLYMSSPINALLEGFCSDDVTIDTLRAKGDFGIGTFNNLFVFHFKFTFGKNTQNSTIWFRSK